MKRIILTVALVISSAAAAAAYGGFFSPGSIGTVIPAPATAYLTCYTVDSGYQVIQSNTSREDILATLVTPKDASGNSSVCFLRPPTQTGEWRVALPPAPQPPTGYPPAINPCEAFPGFVLGKHGGCVPPNHPDAQWDALVGGAK